MKAYTALLVAGVGAIAAIAAVLAVDIGRVTVATADYALHVDPLLDRQNLFTTARITVQNVGSHDLTGVSVNFGGGDRLLIGGLDAGQKMIVSPPEDNAMEMVVVTANEGLIVTKEYREPPKMVGMMGS